MAKLLLVTSIFPPETGGPATFISALAPALREAGHQVRVFTLWDREPQERPAFVSGLSRSIPVLPRQGLIWLRLLSLVSWADLVYINGLELPAVAAVRALGKPSILKIVGDYAWERARLRGQTGLDIDPYQNAPLPPLLALQRRIRTGYTRAAGMVVTPSRYLAGLVAGWGVPRGRIRVVLNGLTPLSGDNKPDETQPGEPGRNREVVLTAARLVDWKGIDHLIVALDLMNQPARLRILGEGQERPRLEALAASLGVSPRVEFAGRLPRSEVLAQMDQARVFALASGYEGLPHVVLEAMSRGCPVVAAAAGGTPEVVEEGVNGLLVPYADPPALALALDKVLAEDALAQRLGRAARKRAGEFPWSRTVSQNMDLIKEMLP